MEGWYLTHIPTLSPHTQSLMGSKLKLETRGITSDKTEGLGTYGLDTWAEEVTEGHNPGEASQPGTQQAR